MPFVAGQILEGKVLLYSGDLEVDVGIGEHGEQTWCVHAILRPDPKLNSKEVYSIRLEDGRFGTMELESYYSASGNAAATFRGTSRPQ